MKLNELLKITIVVSVLFTHSAHALPVVFGELVVFGDSLSSGTDSYVSPLAEKLGATSLNYAQPGATSGNMLNRLQNEYLASLPNIDSSTAFLINVGLNDGWYGYPIKQDILNTTINNISQMISSLVSSGAEHIYLTDFMNRGRNPAVAKFAADNGFDFDQVSDLLGAGSIDASNQLFSAIGQLGVNVKFLGLAEIMVDIEQNMVNLGFASDSLPFCFQSNSFPGGECMTHNVYGIDGSSPDPEKLIYGDGIHPSAHVHRIWADRLGDEIRSLVVPEPAILALIAIGIAALGFIRRRQGFDTVIAHAGN